MQKLKKACLAVAACAAMCASSPALAGPFIIDGTDADDHGFASGGANQDGWLYIQKALENIASGSSLTKNQKTIAVLGSDANTQASLAVQSAVNLSSNLSSAGWTTVLLNDNEIADFFNNTGSGLHSSDASIIYMDSTSNNVLGGLNSSEQSIIDSFATSINTFVGSGGGLFTHSQGYGWLSALIPGLTTVFGGDQGIALTGAGNAAFPGLTNTDLSTGPYHNIFENVGPLPILGVDDGGLLAGSAVILGGAGGSISDPDPTGSVPEPSTWALAILGIGMIGGMMRKRPVGHANETAA